MNFKTNDKKLKKILNTRLKFYDGKMYIKFYNKKETQQNHQTITKQASLFYHCILAIILQSVSKMRKEDDDKYYPKIYLEECIYIENNLRKLASKEITNSNSEQSIIV